MYPGGRWVVSLFSVDVLVPAAICGILKPTLLACAAPYGCTGTWCCLHGFRDILSHQRTVPAVVHHTRSIDRANKSKTVSIGHLQYVETPPQSCRRKCIPFRSEDVLPSFIG